MKPNRFLWLLWAAAALSACREPDRPSAPTLGLDLAVDSDPRGATVWVDGEALGTTPDTLFGLPTSKHALEVRLDSAGLGYVYVGQVSALRDTLISVNGPLVLAKEHFGLALQHTASRIRLLTQPSGMLFYSGGSDGAGIRWPSPSSNAYVAGGAPVFAGVGTSVDTVALGVYDLFYHRGRPAPDLAQDASGFRLAQSLWILPPPSLLPYRTVRGIEVSEELVARPDVEDALALRLVFRNVTDRPAYRAADPYVPQEGITYTDAYAGFALDADVGESDDDALSYLPDLATAVVYDGDLREPAFGADAARPGAVGLRVLEAPAGADVVLSGWSSVQDWWAGQVTQWGVREASGYARISGTSAMRDYGALRIGVVSDAVQDWRVVGAVGPLRLAPGDSIALTVAIVLAYPAEGSYTSGAALRAGNPDDAARQAARVLGPLADRARAAEALRP